MTSALPTAMVSEATSSSFNTTLGPTLYERYNNSLMFILLEFSPVAIMVDRCITPIWYVIGIIGNALSAKIWLEKRMRKDNSSAIYLATLAIVDLIFLVLHIFQELKYAWNIKSLDFHVICEGYFVFNLAAQYLSPMLVLGFTVERWIAVCLPFKKGQFCTPERAVRVVAGLITLSFSLCAIQAYFWQYTEKSGCDMRAEALEGGDTSLWAIWTWITEALNFFLVPAVILIFNILVIVEIRRVSRSGPAALPGQQNHNSSRATTVMLLSVSFYVIITTLPATLVYALLHKFPEGDLYLTDEQVRQDSVWSEYIVYLTGRKIVEEVCLSHYACNIFLYLITGVHFRHSLVETFNCKMYNRIKNGPYSEVAQTQRTQWAHTSNV